VLTVAQCAPFQVCITMVPVPQQHEAEGVCFLWGGNQILTFCRWISVSTGCAMAQAVSRQPFTAKDRFRFRAVHVRLVVDEVPLWQVFLPVLQFSPVTTIPPMLYTHSFTYHPHYTMFLSQYFSFPLSLPFHQCSIVSSSWYFSYQKDKRTKPGNL
jgi:hypothetical protein